MRKIIGLGLGIFLFVTGLVVVKTVRATTIDGGCQVYRCYGSPVCVGDGYGGEICSRGEEKWCNGNCGGIDNGGCPPNEHITPNGGCRLNGSGPVQGGGGAACRNASTDCAPGATISLGQPVSTECLSQWDGAFCSPIGTAQRSGGVNNCCSGYHSGGGVDGVGYETCDNPLITTYACCTAGSVESCQAVPGPDVYRTMGWSGDPAAACWNSPGFPQVYYKSSSPTNCHYERIDHGGGEIENAWVCDYAVVCGQSVQSCTCVSVCPTTTAPSNVSITNGSTPGTSVNVSWTLGTGGSAQYFWVDENQYEVAAGCPTAENNSVPRII